MIDPSIGCVCIESQTMYISFTKLISEDSQA